MLKDEIQKLKREVMLEIRFFSDKNYLLEKLPEYEKSKVKFEKPNILFIGHSDFIRYLLFYMNFSKEKLIDKFEIMSWHQ